MSVAKGWLRLVFLVLGAILLGACSTKQPPSVAFALEGPALYLTGEYKGKPLQGSMDRTCMVGMGHLAVESTYPEDGLSCRASIDSPPSKKGRVHGIFACTNGKEFTFALRNLGPDQGVGIAQTKGEDGLLVFFYHPSKEEAHRRLPEVLADMAKARKGN